MNRCMVCGRPTLFRKNGKCLMCDDGKRIKRDTTIPRNNGINEGKKDYKEYLRTNNWQYARDYYNKTKNA